MGRHHDQGVVISWCMSERRIAGVSAFTERLHTMGLRQIAEMLTAEVCKVLLAGSAELLKSVPGVAGDWGHGSVPVDRNFHDMEERELGVVAPHQVNGKQYVLKVFHKGLSLLFIAVARRLPSSCS
jgi:hypothetical protein